MRVEWGVGTGFLPIYVYEMGGSPVDVALVFSVFAAIMVVSQLFWGVVSDFIGKRKILIVAGMLGLLPIYIIMGFQKDVLPLILLRGSTAILKGAVVPCTWAIVSDLSSQRIGRNMGILSSAELAGFAAGPALGGMIADNYGFQNLWFIIGSICFLGGLIFLLLGKESTTPVRREDGIPLFNTLKNKDVITKVLIVPIATSFVLLGFSFLGPNLNVYLAKEFGYSKTFIGAVIFLGTGIATLLQPLSGYFSDKYGRRLVMTISAVSLISGNLILLLGGEVQYVLLCYVMINYYNSFNMVASAYIGNAVNPQERSGALGILNSLGSLARAAASIAGGFVIAAADVPTALKIAAIFPVVAIIMVVFAIRDLPIRARVSMRV
ncbi:MFS transporter [Candidatus Bathyarchaeota archaeon]|nr:MFS transporter [Candidatus Bathyarchaeota archaeon]